MTNEALNDPAEIPTELDRWNWGTFFLADLLAKHAVTCTEAGKDRYGRTLAHCEVEEQDVGASMVRAGWALAFVRYSREYLPQEEEARSAGAGVWGARFVSPWDWRKGAR